MERYIFSGHETFHCRSFWLKKGFEFVKGKGAFGEESAIAKLGVGKNMVLSIKYWLRAFGITNLQDQINYDGPGFHLFEKGLDPFLEDAASLWILHYFLVTNNYASIYYLLFNEFRKERTEFTREQVLRLVKRKCEETSTPYNEKTILRDISVFVKNYLRPIQVTQNIEDEYSGILLELNLLKEIKEDVIESTKKYAIESADREDIPWQIILFGILSFSSQKIISFNDLLSKPCSVGLVFAMSPSGLAKKINEIEKAIKGFHFTDDHGIREIIFDRVPDKWEILKQYYGNK